MKKIVMFLAEHTPPAPVLAVALFFGVILTVAGLFHTTSVSAKHDPPVGYYYNTSPRETGVECFHKDDIDSSRERLRATEAREADAQAALAEAQAEIEQLKRRFNSICPYSTRSDPDCHGGITSDGLICLK